MEIYKDIKGYKGLYKISNFGNVKSLPKRVGKGNGYLTKEKILKFGKTRGYYYVNLSKDDKTKKQKIHRLVATAFVKNPKNKKQVNHKNGIKTDNNAFNLEWVTQSENMLHAYKTGLQKPQKGRQNKRSKPVIQFNMSEKEVQRFESVREAQRVTGAGTGEIAKCCRKEIKHVKKHLWKYE